MPEERDRDYENEEAYLKMLTESAAPVSVAPISETFAKFEGKPEKRNPFDMTVLYSVTIKMLGVTRKVASGAVNQKGTGNDDSAVTVDGDKDLVRVSKRIIDCDEYKSIQLAASDIKAMLRARCVPGVKFIKGGIYPIPTSLVKDVDSRMAEKIRIYNAKVARFLEVYEARAAEARTRLNALADTNDYPSVEVVKKSFGVTTQYVTLGPPTELRSISKEIWDRESEKIQAQCQDAAVQVRDAMRTMFQELVAHMVERLTPAEDGKKKIFKDSLVGNFKEFIDSFKDRNITDDAELASLVTQAQGILAGKSVDVLRKDADVRSTVTEGMASVKASLDKMIADRPTRAVVVDDE